MLNTYMGFVGDPSEAACLIFATSAREAKKLAYPILYDWHGMDWIDIRVRRIPDDSVRHLQRSDEPHAIESPPTCPRCEMWGYCDPDENYCEYYGDEY